MTLTCCLVDGHGVGLHVVAQGGHGDGVVATRLELVHAEAGVGHHHAAAVPIEGGVERLQLMVGDLEISIGNDLEKTCTGGTCDHVICWGHLSRVMVTLNVSVHTMQWTLEPSPYSNIFIDVKKILIDNL